MAGNGIGGRFFKAFAGAGRLDVLQELVPEANDRAPFGADADGKSHDIMLAESFTCAHFVDQEPAIVVERWENQDSLRIGSLDEPPDVQIHTVYEVFIRDAQVPIYY